MGFFSSKKQPSFPWTRLSEQSQLTSIKEDSNKAGIILFKHSTRCSISSSAMSRIERSVDKHDDNITYYHLDLLNHRDISNNIVELFNVEHQSPQALVIKDGNCVYHSSHMNISLEDLEEHAR